MMLTLHGERDRSVTGSDSYPGGRGPVIPGDEPAARPSTKRRAGMTVVAVLGLVAAAAITGLVVRGALQCAARGRR